MLRAIGNCAKGISPALPRALRCLLRAWISNKMAVSLCISIVNGGKRTFALSFIAFKLLRSKLTFPLSCSWRARGIEMIKTTELIVANNINLCTAYKPAFWPMRVSGKAGLHKKSVYHCPDLHKVQNKIFMASRTAVKGGHLQYKTMVNLLSAKKTICSLKQRNDEQLNNPTAPIERWTFMSTLKIIRILLANSLTRWSVFFFFFCMLPLFLFYFYINRVDIQWFLYILLLEYTLLSVVLKRAIKGWGMGTFF